MVTTGRQEPRWNAERRAAPAGAAPRPKRVQTVTSGCVARIVTTRLSAFRLLFYFLPFVGWVERSETHHAALTPNDGFRCAQPILQTRSNKPRTQNAPRERCRSSFPAKAGKGDHLAQQDGGRGAGLDASLSSQEFRRVLRPLHRASPWPTLRVGVPKVRRPKAAYAPSPASRVRMKREARRTD
jgi:hypothetical protein